jgi:pantoate--beta-alanine ligase
MDLLTTIAEVRTWRAERRCRAVAPVTVGFVPTMGFLHEGHLSLVRRAGTENDLVVASLFVNPAQFGANEDLAAYPRDLPRDLGLLRQAGCAMAFAPRPHDMYPRGFDSWVEPGAVAARLEGAHRPGHFRGVATVVLKLFGIVEPTRAYFGQKDAQQLAVIRAMARDLNLPVAVIGCPTVREPDGLAMSSRNVYLSPAERRAATVLSRALLAARSAWGAGARDADALRAVMATTLAEEPLARPDYVSVADPDTLVELDTVAGRAVLSLAVRIGRTRLIDNLLLDPHGED